MKTQSLNIKNICISLILIVSIAASAGIAFGHGGKSHTDSFAGLKALQKAIELYDQLIATGKLSESWETDLEKVEVNTRKTDGAIETAVAFHRSKGEQRTVFFFFTEKGEYSGSNFTGE